MKTRSEIERKVKHIFFDIVGYYSLNNQDQLNIEDNLVDAYGTDSLDYVEIAIALEEEFRMDISDEQLEKFKTLKDIIDYVEAH